MSIKFHRIWFGDRPMPSSYENYWSAWQRQHPDCEFITWTDSNLQDLELSKPGVDRFSSTVSRSDLARLEILYKHGGIYLDCDIMPYNHFNPEDLCRDLTVCNETSATEYCSTSFIGAPAGHQIFLDLIDEILNSEIDESRPNETTGPWLFGKHVRNHRHRRLPTACFFPYLYDEPFSSIRRKNLSNTFGIHVWGGSWLAPELKKKKALELLKKGDILDTSEILDSIDDQWSANHKILLDVIQDARSKCAEAAIFLGDSLTVSPEDQTAFEFEKVVHWLLEQDADRMVWQIGAADGILVDPLRTSLVNFDPPAMLLEPNPYLFQMLESGYRNNRNATLVQRAYSLDEGELVLNAINPHKVAELNLPRWVMGISSVYEDKNPLSGASIDEDTTRLVQSCVERVTVPVIRFAELVDLAQGRTPDILVIDAEGMDKAIIDDILDQGCRPVAIHFEIQWMEPRERQDLIDKLSVDYTLLEFGNDVTAYRTDVFMNYAKWLYVYNGIPTLFWPVLPAIAGLAE